MPQYAEPWRRVTAYPTCMLYAVDLAMLANYVVVSPGVWTLCQYASAATGLPTTRTTCCPARAITCPRMVSKCLDKRCTIKPPSDRCACGHSRLDTSLQRAVHTGGCASLRSSDADASVPEWASCSCLLHSQGKHHHWYACDERSEGL